MVDILIIMAVSATTTTPTETLTRSSIEGSAPAVLKGIETTGILETTGTTETRGTTTKSSIGFRFYLATTTKPHRPCCLPVVSFVSASLSSLKNPHAPAPATTRLTHRPCCLPVVSFVSLVSLVY